jgi:serine kinase of HPr protein (carbohydrate metabolism regulator)
LFVGASGAGKTTMARLWLAERDAVILSDDRVVLRGEPDGLWMYGTPWHGEEPLASPDRVRLAGVFFLHHHERHEIAPVTRIDGVARLFAASFPPFHDARALDFTLGFIDSPSS